MPLYKISFRFEGGGVGWTESHILNSSNQLPRTIASNLTNICQLRANMLGSPFFMNGYRVAFIRDDAGNPVKRAVSLVKTQFFPQTSTGQPPGDESPVAVQAQMKDTTERRTKQVFLGGIPDGVCNKSNIYNGAVANFQGNFNSWSQAMLTFGNGTFGWLEWVPFLPQQLITGYTVDTTGRVVFTTSGATLPTPYPSPPEMARVSGLNQSKSPLNGQLLIQITAANTFRTVNPIGCGPYVSGGKVTIYTFPQPYIAASLITVGGTAKHKRGNRSWGSAGRAPKRIRY